MAIRLRQKQRSNQSDGENGGGQKCDEASIPNLERLGMGEGELPAENRQSPDDQQRQPRQVLQ